MPILKPNTVEFISHSVEQTVRLGVRLGELLVPTDLVCLSGELGAGKTAMARGIGQGWGTDFRVTSPTFTLINEYPRRKDGRILYHVDSYRLERPEDVWSVGLEEVLEADGAVMIEWPERVLPLLPEDRLWIELSYQDETRRRVHLSASGERPFSLLQAFRAGAFGK